MVPLPQSIFCQTSSPALFLCTTPNFKVFGPCVLHKRKRKCVPFTTSARTYVLVTSSSETFSIYSTLVFPTFVSIRKVSAQSVYQINTENAVGLDIPFSGVSVKSANYLIQILLIQAPLTALRRIKLLWSIANSKRREPISNDKRKNGLVCILILMLNCLYSSVVGPCRRVLI